jgi:uncharacterized protein YukE
MFEYNPAAIPDLVHSVAMTRGQLEDIRHQALNALQSVREELQGAGGMSYEDSQLHINSGIDGCEQTLNHQCQVITHVLDSMVNTDLSAAKSLTI